MKIFAVRPLDEMLQRREQSLRDAIRQDADDRIVGVDLNQLVDYFVSQYIVELLNLDVDKAELTVAEVMVDARDLPGGNRFYAEEGRKYPKTQITVHVPFGGNQALLERVPSSRLLWTHEVNVGASELTFSVVIWDEHAGADTANREIADVLKNIKLQAANVDREIETFNGSLRAKIERAINERRESILKRRNLTAALTVPVRRAPEGAVPRAFTVPVAKKPLITRPEPAREPFKPEPTLADAVYADILKLIHEFGVTMERLPSLYAGKDEEALRDHLLLVLTPHFQSATGETFNKAGKTDILVRHERKNVFVAECKLWKGAQGLLETIDQVLGYLTWRDSKAAVIMFVKNKDIAAVVDQIPAVVPTHSCFVKANGRVADGWHSFAFHLPGDKSRALTLSVQCFHFPPMDKADA